MRSSIPVRGTAVVGAFFALLVVTSAALADVHADYSTPTFTVPFAAHPPTIDGTIRDEEWKDALSVNALQTTDGNVGSRPTTFYMLWDADNIYIAMRSPLRPGERVMQAQREIGRDNEKTVFDDAYEIFLDFGTRSPDGEIVFFQYLGNVAGAKYDVMFEPTVGNSRPGWESGWKPRNRITPDGKYWEMDVAIPRKSVYQDEPLAEGKVIRGLLIRDFKRPWEQNNVGGSGSFSAPDSHCKFVLSKSAPAIHLLDVADVANQTLGASLSCDGGQQPLKWTFTSDGGASQSGDLPVDGKPAGPGLDADRPGDGYYRIKVTSSDEKTTWLDWCSRRKFGDMSATTQSVVDAGDQANLNLTFNPVFNYVRVEGDFINYDHRGDIKRFEAAIVDDSGNSLAQQALKLDSLSYVHGLLKLGDAPAGSYSAELVGYDANDKEVFRKTTPFEKKDLAKEYPWWNTTVGNIERVIAPWTAMKRQGNKIGVWGRTMQVGAAGLPAQISSQGMDLLAEPIRLVAETSSGTISAVDSSATKCDTARDYRVAFSSAGKLGDGITVASQVTSESDGMYKIQLTLTPTQATDVRSLKVIVPVKPEFAEYSNACGEGIRYGFSYGYLDKDKRGVLWDSKQVDGQPMLVGSFIPYVWLGNDKAGLCWFADGDAGWSPSDKTPAIEIRRDAEDHVDLVLNLISEPETLTAPRTITFAFEATPVKPLRDGWRMETWSTADSFQDFCRVEPRGGHLIWNALPFTLDPTASKQMVEQRQHMDMGYEFGFVSPKYHANAVPYFENNGIDKNFAPASDYFSDQWHARVSDSLCFSKSLTDFIVWNLSNWCQQTGIDGWYVDNVRPVACDNIDAGRGYRLPDGRIQPTYQMFDTRIHFLRVRAAFADLGKSGKFVLHMTNHMIMPWIGAADLALDGEDHVTFPEMNKDFIDFWSPTRLRLDYWRQSGTAVTFLQEYQGNWQTPDLDRVMRAYTAMTILNDVLPGANPNGHNPAVWRGRNRFGIDTADVTFHPYWEKNSGIAYSGDGIYAASWRKPGAVLIAVVNTATTKNAVALQIDKGTLGLSGVASAVDADTGEAMAMQADGSIVVPVERHDYRQVMISAQ
jgi:hypothetical protein